MSGVAHEETIPEQISALAGRVEGLETRLAEELEAEVAKAVGPIVAKAVAAELEPYVEKIRDLTGRLGTAAGNEAAGVDAWAHAKISAIVSAVQRAIGIEIPLPTAPGEHVIGDVKVTGAETADQLSKG